MCTAAEVAQVAQARATAKRAEAEHVVPFGHSSYGGRSITNVLQPRDTRMAHTFRSIKDTTGSALRHGVEDGFKPWGDQLLVHPPRREFSFRLLLFLVLLPPAATPPHARTERREYGDNAAGQYNTDQGADRECHPVAAVMVIAGS